MPKIPTPGDDRAKILHAPTETREVPGESFRCPRCETEYEGADACPACGTLRVAAACEPHPDRDAVGRCGICGRRLESSGSTGDRSARSARSADDGTRPAAT